MCSRIEERKYVKDLIRNHHNSELSYLQTQKKQTLARLASKKSHLLHLKAKLAHTDQISHLKSQKSEISKLKIDLKNRQESSLREYVDFLRALKENLVQTEIIHADESELQDVVNSRNEGLIEHLDDHGIALNTNLQG